MNRQALLSQILLGLAASIGGCAGGQAEFEGLEPHVSALSTYQASLGTPIEVFGTDFPDPTQGRFFLTFEGRFISDSGEESLVLKDIELSRSDEDRAVWTTFGPYEIPFGDGSEPGVFDGTVMAKVMQGNKEIYTDREPMDLTFEVKPSIAVREFQPTTANCKDGEVRRLIGGMPYRMQIETLGFEPKTVTYTISAPGLESLIPTFSMRRLANGKFDTLGEDEEFIIPPVPNEIPFYAVNITIEATDMNGESHGSNFSMAVRRPLDIFFPPGPIEVAEFYEPQPVEGQAFCIDGGKNGLERDFSITSTETETRGYSFSWDESWQQSITVERGSQTTISEGVVNSIGFSTSDGTDFNWGWHDTLGGAAKGGANFAIVNFGGEINGSHRWFEENRVTQTSSADRGRQETLSRSETTTASQAATRANTIGKEEQTNGSVSVTESVGQSYRVKCIARHKCTLYTQKTRLIKSGDGVIYNQCGEAFFKGKVSYTNWSWNLGLGQHKSDSCNPPPKPDLPQPECFADDC